MASETEIYNLALGKIGAARVTSTTDQSVNARACNNIYRNTRDALLRAHPWSFAIQRFQLALGPAPAFGPANSFPLPTGWLRLLSPDVWQNVNDLDWKIENGCVITNNYDSGPNSTGQVLNVRCVMKVEDPNKMDVSFINSLAARMSVELAEILTQSNSKKQAAAADYKNSIEEAKKNNAIEQVPQVAAEDLFITARA